MWAMWVLWAIWGEWGLVSVSCEPLFRVELGALFTQLELQDIVFAYGSESLAFADTLTACDAD